MTTEIQTSAYNVKEAGVLGDIQIADEVIAIIAGLAATEVEGVAKMYGNITNELVSKIGIKNLSKGVKVSVTPEEVKVDLSLEVRYGYSVMDVSKTVQEKVKQAIETMTGLEVSMVRVRIAGVAIEKSEKVSKSSKA
ncbi:MAG: Asp23/Gls24 family envelope stress response protein [Lachnospiraceae bacterium]|nr:Asp23/Gls24 family envelope stress response protein [Lachnospiraceae bacterium]